MALEIEQRFLSLQRLVDAANTRGMDEQLAAHLSKLSSIIVCGTIERSIEYIFVQRFVRTGNEIPTFLKSYFKRGTNYDCEEIKMLMYKFSTLWGRQFEEFVAANNRVKESIASCYAVRNSIAHGGGQSVGPRAVRQYSIAALDLVSAVEGIVR